MTTREWYEEVLENSGYNHIIDCVSMFLATYSGDVLHYEDIETNLHKEILRDPDRFDSSVINLLDREIGFELYIF